MEPRDERATSGAEEKAHLYRVTRWRGENLDIPLWHRRTAHMAALLRSYLALHGEHDQPLRLLEFGCGAMALEHLLATSGLDRIEYLPSDCFARDDRTLVLDLNEKGALGRVPAVDVIFIGGVLEYLEDVEAVLRKLATRTRYLFFSYCPRTPDQDESERLGWSSHWTEDEMTLLARALGTDLVVDASFDREVPKPVRTFFVRTETGAPSR